MYCMCFNRKITLFSIRHTAVVQLFFFDNQMLIHFAAENKQNSTRHKSNDF